MGFKNTSVTSPLCVYVHSIITYLFLKKQSSIPQPKLNPKLKRLQAYSWVFMPLQQLLFQDIKRYYF